MILEWWMSKNEGWCLNDEWVRMKDDAWMMNEEYIIFEK